MSRTLTDDENHGYALFVAMYGKPRISFAIKMRMMEFNLPCMIFRKSGNSFYSAIRGREAGSFLWTRGVYIVIDVINIWISMHDFYWNKANRFVGWG